MFCNILKILGNFAIGFLLSFFVLAIINYGSNQEFVPFRYMFF